MFLQIHVLQIHLLQIHVFQIQSIFYKSNPGNVLQYALSLLYDNDPKVIHWKYIAYQTM